MWSLKTQPNSAFSRSDSVRRDLDVRVTDKVCSMSTSEVNISRREPGTRVAAVAVLGFAFSLTSVVAIYPLLNFVFEVGLDYAIQVTGILDGDDGPIGSDFSERQYVQVVYRVAVPDQNFDRYVDSDQFIPGHSQLSQAARAGGWRSASLALRHSFPDFLETAAFTKPPHSPDNGGEDAILMERKEFDGNHATH